MAVTAEHCRDSRDCDSNNCATGTTATCTDRHVCTCDAPGSMTTMATSKILSYSHTVTFRGLRFTTFPSPTFCPKFVRFCRLLGFSTFIATFCDVLLRISTYCPVIQRLRATVSLGIGTFSYVFTTCRYVFLRFSRFYQVITT